MADGSVIQVYEKGADGVIAARVLRGDSVVVTAGWNVHVKILKRYVNEKCIQLKKRVYSKLEVRRNKRVSAFQE